VSHPGLGTTAEPIGKGELEVNLDTLGQGVSTPHHYISHDSPDAVALSSLLLFFYASKRDCLTLTPLLQVQDRQTCWLISGGWGAEYKEKGSGETCPRSL
jgi:hypothetical protein